ncbi:MAG: hypothetical protein Q7K38_00955 [Candidatus Wildermuthbacteria bacterium]|nr:hypothetical protein [Candidatus Wildermuthbacteria bacterium]
MRQVISVVAVNFGDLIQLKLAVGQVLYGLLHLRPDDQVVSVTFSWVSDRWDVRIGAIKSQFLKMQEPPQGVSGGDWARLVAEELRNHLLAGNRFVLKEDGGNDNERFLELRLQRA